MQLTFMDFTAIVKIALVFFASSFALLIPLYAYLKNFNTSLKVCIPLSLAIEILVGYVFYTLGQIKIFPLVYLLIILSINIIFAFRLKLFQQIEKVRFKFDWKVVLPIFLVMASVIFSRFYDALRNIAPGAIDAPAHAQYVLDLVCCGRLSSVYYPPGFHILIYPLTKVADLVDIYRFSGPVLGIITLLSLYLLFRDFFKNKLSLFFLALAFGLPVFNILTLQTIGFFPTALTFVFLPTLIYILIKPEELSARKGLALYSVTMASLAITVPYLFVQFIPAMLILNIIALATIRMLKKEYVAFLSKISLISIIGFALAFSLVYLQNRVVKKEGVDNFPQISIARSNDSGLVVSTTNVDKTQVFLNDHKTIAKKFGANIIVKNYLIPMVMTGGDVIAVKNIRPLNSLMSAAAYFWIIVSLMMIYFGIKRKNHLLLVFGSLILTLGAATQTGILEMSTYRGRSGWYLILLVLIISIYLLDQIIRKIPKGVSYALLALVLIASFASPPTFYRGYYSDYFIEGRKIAEQFPNQKILVSTDEPRILVISNNFVFDEFVPDSVGNVCPLDQCFLIFANKLFEVDPIRSQSTLAIDKDQKNFKADWAELKKTHEQTVEAIKNSQNFSKYKIYWENENLSIYKLQN